VRLQTDSQHCGSCTNDCGPGVVCSLGQCANSCIAPLVTCNGGAACADPMVDPDNCNGCGLACPVVPHATRLCVQGMCGRSVCDLHFYDCNFVAGDGCEANLLGDDLNCGFCGIACAGPLHCVNGTCQ
jgi:hypothetical protein